MTYLPSILSVMAPARMPPNAPDRTAADMNTANLFDCSFFLYQDDMIKRIPGENPASKIPTIILRATSCSKVWMRAMQQVQTPQITMITGRNIDGFVLDRIRLLGTSKATYVTKN